MWFLLHKSFSIQDLLNGSTDYHSHILPGVDDGVQSMDEALRILQLYEKLGVKSLWLTPHIMEDIPNTTIHLKERLSELQAAHSGDIELHLSAEYMLDQVFQERLESNDLLPLGEKGNHLLVETSYFNPPLNLHQTLQQILSKGYYPILAHPERYMYMDKSEYRQLKEMGIRLQLNLLSLIGMYGTAVKKKAEWLLANGMYDISGSDLHRQAIMSEFATKRKIKGSTLQILQSIVATPLS